MFAGDDDTVLFIDPAMELVKDLDPEVPYFLTGSSAWSTPCCLRALTLHQHTLHQYVHCVFYKVQSLSQAESNWQFSRTCSSPRKPIEQVSALTPKSGLLTCREYMCRSLMVFKLELWLSVASSLAGTKMLALWLWPGRQQSSYENGQSLPVYAPSHVWPRGWLRQSLGEAKMWNSKASSATWRWVFLLRAE